MINNLLMSNYPYGFRYEINRLFVGDLPQKIEKQKFTDFIRSKDPNCQIDFNFGMRGPTAIISVHSFEEAKKVKLDFNFSMFENKEIRVTDYDNTIWKGRGNNLFIVNLPNDFRSKDLFDFYSKYGEIFSAKVPYDIEGKPKGFGYVCYKDKESAAKALQATNDTDLRGKKIQVYLHRSNRERSLIPKKCLYFNNLPESFYLDKDKFKLLFKDYGNIGNLDVKESILNEKSGATKKGFFGYVCFDDEAVAKKVKDEFSGKQFENNTIFVDFIKSKSERAREKDEQKKRSKQDACNRTLYAKYKYGEITMTEKQIIDEFSRFGEIKAVTIKTSDSKSLDNIIVKKNSPIMFIEFMKEESAKKALNEYKNGSFELSQLIDRQTLIMQKRSKRNYNAPMNYQMRMDQRAIHPGFHPYNNMQPRTRRPPNRFPSMNRRAMMFEMPRPMMRMPQNLMPAPVYDQNMVGGPIPFAINPQAKYMGMPMVNPNFVNMMGMNPPQMAGRPLNMQFPMNNIPPNIPVPAVMSQNIPIPPPQNEINQNPENLGEEIYNRISGLCSENQRGKVTGMLLELDITVQQEILTNDKKLHQLVEEAKILLESKT